MPTAAFPPISGPPGVVMGLKPRSDRSPGLWGMFRDRAGRSSVPGMLRASGLRAAYAAAWHSSSRIRSGTRPGTLSRTPRTNIQNERPERTPRTNTQNEHPDAALASVPVNAGLSAPVHLRLFPGRLEPHACTPLPASPAQRHAGLRYGAPPTRPSALTSLRSATQFSSPSDVHRPAYPVWGLELRCPPGSRIGRMPSGQFKACTCEGRGYRPQVFRRLPGPPR